MVKLKIDGILDSMKYDCLFPSTNSCSNREADRSASELQFSEAEVAEGLSLSWEGRGPCWGGLQEGLSGKSWLGMEG